MNISKAVKPLYCYAETKDSESKAVKPCVTHDHMLIFDTTKRLTNDSGHSDVDFSDFYFFFTSTDMLTSYTEKR